MKTLMTVLIGLGLLIPNVSMAAELTESQTNSILGVLSAFGADRSVIEAVRAIIEPKVAVKAEQTVKTVPVVPVTVATTAPQTNIATTAPIPATTPEVAPDPAALPAIYVTTDTRRYMPWNDGICGVVNYGIYVSGGLMTQNDLKNQKLCYKLHNGG